MCVHSSLKKVHPYLQNNFVGYITNGHYQLSFICKNKKINVHFYDKKYDPNTTATPEKIIFECKAH